MSKQKDINKIDRKEIRNHSKLKQKEELEWRQFQTGIQPRSKQKKLAKNKKRKVQTTTKYHEEQ